MTERVTESRRAAIKTITLRDDALERFWQKVSNTPVRANECWLWTGRLTKGYGNFRQGKTQYAAHRVAYTLFVGAIPNGAMIDHLCRNRACVNPQHLELVTNAENIKRAPWTAVDLQAEKTHCPAGHAYDEANTYRWRNERHCRSCGRKRAALRRDRPNGPARITVTIEELP